MNQPRSRRWALCIASPPGRSGSTWGDTYFAESLGAALRRLGEAVMIVRRGEEHDLAGEIDVLLVLRGLIELAPQAGAVNILWVISHPELVTPVELRRFDCVFASSQPWSRSMSKDGMTVVPLLQATDVWRFGLEPAASSREGVVFVGSNLPNRTRETVMDAVAAGVDLRVWGSRWEGILTPTSLRGEHLPNEYVPARYRGAARVLADHWEDMRELGFLQNRLFDAAACGTPVISDDVVGLRDVFPCGVLSYDGIDDLADLCSAAADPLFGSEARRCEFALQIAQEHSFDARARSLVEAVSRA